MSRYLVLVFAGAAFAAAFAQQSSMEHFAGVVLGIDSANRLVSVEEASVSAEKRTFSVPAQADIRKQDRTIELSAIRDGDPVSIGYETTAAGLVARTVKILTIPKSASAQP